MSASCIVVLMDNTTRTNMFQAKSTDLGNAFSTQDTARAASILGVMIGMTVSLLPDDDAMSFFRSVYDLDSTTPQDVLENAAGFVAQTFYNNID